MSTADSPLLVIVGPTGSGKTDLALMLAARFRGEIVSCDSVQVYRGFDIGSAKTPFADRHGIPHHLIDVADATDVFTAGDYQTLARQALSEITRRGNLPVVVGGTGFYLRALLHGLFAGPGRDEDLRDRLRARAIRRPASLHRLLRRFDRSSAEVIHANDHQKLIRALEVCLIARRPISRLHAVGASPLMGYRLLRIGLQPPRSALVSRIDERTRRMYADGLVEETRQILARGVPPTAKPLQSVGYLQALGVLQGALSPADALAETQLRTRQYAKRQLTWFRRDTAITWYAEFGYEPALQNGIATLTFSFLDS